MRIQVKAPYTALSRGGLKLKMGEVMDADPEDPRVAYWLNNGLVEEVREEPKAQEAPEKSPKQKRGK